MAIGPVIRFLQAARSMAKQGMKKEQILDFARREFGKVSELLKKQIDDIYSRYKKPAKTGEKGEVIPFKKKETKDIVKKRTDDIIKERTEDMQPTGELMKDIEQRIEDIKKIKVKKYNPFDDFLGPSKPLNKREGIVRTAAREILEKNKIKIGREDPIDVLRKTYGEAGLEAVDNIGDTLLDAQSYGEIKNILTKNKLFDLTPKKVSGYDQSVIVGEKIRKQLETEAKHKKILEDFDPDRIPNASGGIAGQLHLNRPGFDKGKKVDLSKRKFLKGAGAGLGVLSMLPFVGKFFKPAAKAAKALTKVPMTQTADMPSWFPSLVNKVIKQGDDVTKQYATVERQIVHQSTLPNSKTPVTVTQDLTSGNVSVDIGMGKHGWGDGHLGQPVRLEYKASEVIEPTISKKGKVTHKGGKTEPEFNIEEAEFTGGHPENIKFEESTIEKFGSHGSNFDEVEKFATGKVTKTKPSIKAERAHWVPEGDYASGGIAGQLHLNQGGEAMLDPDYGPHTQTINDDWYKKKYKQFLDGYLKAQEGSSNPLSQQDINIINSFYNNLKKHGGDTTEFDERIKKLLQPQEPSAPVPDSRSAKRPKWWYDPEELDPFEKKPWDEEEEEEEETSRGLSNILRV